MKFPTITGTNLLRQKMTLPDALEGEINILVIAFFQWHQALVDSWVPTLIQLEQALPRVKFYEVPVIHKMNFLAQTFINEGMRAGIPKQDTRGKTITLYTDKEAFRKTLDIPDENIIYILVLDRQGNVIWKTEGPYHPQKSEALLLAIQEVQKFHHKNEINSSPDSFH